MTEVALCADPNIRVGLHVTLFSLLESITGNVSINFIHRGYDGDALTKIEDTLRPFKGRYRLNPIPADDEPFAGFRGLYGNRFAYMRILLSSILKSPRVVYLDSDLIVRKDVKQLYETDIGGHVIAASGVGNVEWALERAFLLEIGHQLEDKYFNSGVLVLDLEEWRKRRIEEECLAFGRKHATRLATADQTILNGLFGGTRFFELPPAFNSAIYPDSPSKPTDAFTDAIFHFVGSPKPWDLFGEFVHGNYPFFKSVMLKTEFADYRSYRHLNPQLIRRTFRLSRSYLRVIARRASNKS